MTEDPSFWDWLWFTALDGIVGAILGGFIGGFAAWYLLRITIRNERHRAAHAELRGAVSALRAQAYRMIRVTGQIVGQDRSPLEWPDQLWETTRLIHEVQALAGAAGEEKLDHDLESFGEVFPVSDTVDTRKLEADVARLTALIGVLHGWSRDRVGYRLSDPTDWSEKIATATAGSIVDEPTE
ncbi:hypothetical protein [Pimelobacter simplex]|uniref:hypothetical protein n=1 Tax=Nocardioides simplex TaxID=2045 RepID=UPI0021504C11|nr:hypothetical protein [Pimelobacter simplex]UUW88449.1 hypothetical protein M0M43_22280 [Pimelobacter simplex]UUW97953.1 hypothetical protein M0M48_10925 [Pimelobacter simplex]